MATNLTNVPGTNMFVEYSSNLRISQKNLDGYAVLAECDGTPPTTSGLFSHGCIIIQKDSGTGNPALFQNIGNVTNPSWKLLNTSPVADIQWQVVYDAAPSGSDVFINAGTNGLFPVLASNITGGNVVIPATAGGVVIIDDPSASPGPDYFPVYFSDSKSDTKKRLIADLTQIGSPEYIGIPTLLGQIIGVYHDPLASTNGTVLTVNSNSFESANSGGVDSLFSSNGKSWIVNI